MAADADRSRIERELFTLSRRGAQHALDRGHEVVGVCRERSVEKLDAFEGRITVVPGATNDREVMKRAVVGCDGVLVVLAPWGVRQYASGTAQAVLDYAPPGARLVFSCGWHITRDGQDVYSLKLKAIVKILGGFARLVRVAELDDQVEACRRVFASDTRWTVVRGSDLEEGESQGLPLWSRHVGDPILESNGHRHGRGLHRLDEGALHPRCQTPATRCVHSPSTMHDRTWPLTPSSEARTPARAGRCRRRKEGGG